jgi:hypothetical protein
MGAKNGIIPNTAGFQRRRQKTSKNFIAKGAKLIN